MTYMLDTNICIYLIRKKSEKVFQRFAKERSWGICISTITLAELAHGVKHSSDPQKNKQALYRFLAPLSVLPFDAAAAYQYGDIKAYLQSKGTPIGIMDMLIAAHARAENLILVTHNVKEFERVPGLTIEDWVD